MTTYIFDNLSLALYLIETPFKAFANRADPDQAADALVIYAYAHTEDSDQLGHHPCLISLGCVFYG